MNDLDVPGRLHDLADDLGGPHDEISPAAVIALYRRHRRARAALVATVTAVVAIMIAVPSTIAGLSSDGSVAVPSPTVDPTRTVPTTAPDAPVEPTAPAPSTSAPTSTPDPAALADLDGLAATLTTRIALTSPAAWDQWLPQGKPYPGTSTEEEMSTCPHLADRLTKALGKKMSYWVGTLPLGPYGCQWVPVPLEYDSPNYDYVIAVGFVDDGTTATSLARGFGTAGGPCPWKKVPAAAPGAVLVRCAEPESTEYTLALPDTRLPGGLWTLIVNVKDRAAVRGPQIFPVLIDGVTAAYG